MLMFAPVLLLIVLLLIQLLLQLPLLLPVLNNTIYYTTNNKVDFR